MNLAAYSAVVFPSTPVVLGVTLRPLTLGHALLLVRLDSPFFGGARGADGLPGDGDLYTTLALCSRDPLDPPTRRAVEWLWLLNCLRREVELVDAKQAVLDYVQAACRVPETLAQPGAKRGATTLLQAVCLAVQTEFGQSREAMLRTPVAEAISNCFHHWHAHGRVALKTEEIAAAFAAHDELLARVARGELTAEQLLAQARADDAARLAGKAARG